MKLPRKPDGPNGPGNPIHGSDGREESSTLVLSLDHVGRTFPSVPPVEALRDASFDVRAGEVLGIVGRSGSGKSTLLNVLGLLDRLTSGSYQIAGRSAADLSEREQTELRSSFFGFVFQQSFLLASRTAQENVEIALRPRGLSAAERRRRAIDALGHVGLGHRRRSLPTTLSGGECQRVAIARAIAQDPRVLLCDEPTGNLDERTTDDVLELLIDAKALGVVVVMVTHDLTIARALPRVVTVRDGIVTEGLEEFLSAQHGRRGGAGQ